MQALSCVFQHQEYLFQAEKVMCVLSQIIQELYAQKIQERDVDTNQRLNREAKNIGAN